MIEGLNSISDLLHLYRIIEELYLRDANKPAHPDFVQAVVELYSNIFEYQTQLICHLSQSSFKRGIRGTLELDNWGDKLKKVQTSNDSCMQYCTLSDREREKAFYNNASTHMLLSVDIQKRILDMFEERAREHIKDEHQYISELPAPLLDPLYLVFLALLYSIFGPSLQVHFGNPHPKPSSNFGPLPYAPILALGE